MDLNLDQANAQFIAAARARTFWAPTNPLFATLFAFVQDRAHSLIDVAKYGVPDRRQEDHANGILRTLKHAEAGVISQPPFLDRNGRPAPDDAELYLERGYHQLAFTEGGKHFVAVRCGHVIHWVVDEANFFAPPAFSEAEAPSQL